MERAGRPGLPHGHTRPGSGPAGPGAQTRPTFGRRSGGPPPLCAPAGLRLPLRAAGRRARPARRASFKFRAHSPGQGCTVLLHRALPAPSFTPPAEQPIRVAAAAALKMIIGCNLCRCAGAAAAG